MASWKISYFVEMEVLFPSHVWLLEGLLMFDSPDPPRSCGSNGSNPATQLYTEVSLAILTQGAADVEWHRGWVTWPEGSGRRPSSRGRPNLDVAPAVKVALRAVASSLLQGDPSFTSLVRKGAARGAAKYIIIVTYSYYRIIKWL